MKNVQGRWKSLTRVAQFIVRWIQILLGADGEEQVLEIRPRRHTGHVQLIVR